MLRFISRAALAMLIVLWCVACVIGNIGWVWFVLGTGALGILAADVLT